MNENQHLVVVQAFVAQLYQAGLRDVCVSPGSRSTPLTMAFARHGGFSLWSVLDERSSGFFAVGMARSKQRPIALVCTSGTAAGNYLPAVMEAHHARLPLIVLTADRPPELYDTGANQTTYQRNLYGSFVKWHHDMPVPQNTPSLIRHAVSAAARAIAAATQVPTGPVHVNLPFREPLIIPEEPFELPSAGEAGAGTQVWDTESRLPAQAVEALQEVFAQHHRGLLMCGPGLNQELAEPVTRLASVHGWPILADPLSQLRAGAHNKSQVIDTYDVLMRNATFRDLAKPDVIVRFGAAMTSKVIGQFLVEHADVRQIVVDEGDVWVDPGSTATDIVRGSVRGFCEQLSASPSREGVRESDASPWLSWWQQVNANLGAALQDETAAATWFEGQLVPELLNLLPKGANVFIGNSMPIRDFDSFMPAGSKPLQLFANRGVSGIDGIVSSALGVAAASANPTFLVIGDVSFYHDLNALLIAKRNHVNLTIVVVNNDGGGIFTFLPQAQHKDTFEHFRTSHGMEFSGVASLYDVTYQSVSEWPAFRDAMDEFSGLSGVRIVELTFDPDQNREQHRHVFDTLNMSVQRICDTSNTKQGVSNGRTNA